MKLTYNHEIRTLLKQFESRNIIKAEQKRKISYEKNGWKKFYDINKISNDNNSENIFNNKDFIDTEKIVQKLINFSDIKFFGRIFETKMFCINNNEIYQGTINLNNKKHGFGTSILRNGYKYTGYWYEDNFEGWGEIIDKEGNIFQGFFSNGILNGKGEKFGRKGCHYQGDFLRGLKHGYGKEITKDYKYIGNWEKNKKNNYGSLTYLNNNDEYEGIFYDNEITGKGKYKWNNGDIFEGDFLRGKMHGKGIYKWPDGGEYEGDYANNIKEGRGRFKWSNGKIFEGPFISGEIFF